MYVFRIHIRPQGGSADMKATFDYCLKEGVLGVGWGIPSFDNTNDWDAYYEEASRIYDNLQICKYIKKWVSAGDLLWTRDTSGQYYLAKVVSGWEYLTTDESRRLNIDIANCFRCEIRAVALDAVPGKVIACFRATRSIQEIAQDTAREYSKFLWNKLSGTNAFEISASSFNDIFMMLDDEETEDLVFLYLQSKGWYVVPHSRKGDSMTFEYMCVNPVNGKIAATQVKTGNTPLDRDAYTSMGCQVFLFQANDIYCGVGADNVTAIFRDEILRFLDEAKRWLPDNFKFKLEMVSQ